MWFDRLEISVPVDWSFNNLTILQYELIKNEIGEETKQNKTKKKQTKKKNRNDRRKEPEKIISDEAQWCNVFRMLWKTWSPIFATRGVFWHVQRKDFSSHCSVALLSIFISADDVSACVRPVVVRDKYDSSIRKTLTLEFGLNQTLTLDLGLIKSVCL